MNRPENRTAGASGFTLVELLVTTAILGAVLLVVTSIFVSSGRVESRTVRRAEVQASGRQAVSLMTAELRQAGADPSTPPAGIVGIVSADSSSIRVRADLNGDGTIQTAEPSEDVTYRYDAVAATVTRDPGTGAAPIVTHVRDMNLSYFDSANQPLGPLPLNATLAARVKAIGLTITTENGDSRPITFTTRITLRNR